MQNLIHPKSSNMFRGPYYNRRRTLTDLLTKPLISKLPGTSTWVCVARGGIVKGFGLTPAAAYNDWKQDMDLLS